MNVKLVVLKISLILSSLVLESSSFLHVPTLKRATITRHRNHVPVPHLTSSSRFSVTRLPFGCTQPLLSTRKEDDDGGGEASYSRNKNNNIPDSETRRQILFSLLASASVVGGGGGAIPATAAAAAVVAGKTGSTESTTTAATATTAVFTDVIKPPLDNREYLTYQLPNGLRVLLCSDPSSLTAAAAMDVHVGACSDPVEVPGLAHFNEHMLFLGTEQYPKEDSFSTFLSANGGSSNAYTESENTVYFFDMEAEADSKLSEGLRRFGSFFTSPLFTESATGRELNAIDSENSKNLQSDVFRGYQIEKSRANSAHPYSKFYTGNKKTLLENTKAQGINLRDELIKFHGTYYSSNQMTLAVVAPQKLDTVRKFVDDAFGSIPNREVDKPEVGWSTIPAFSENSSIIPGAGHVVEIVPVQDLRQVSLTWPILYTTEEEKQDRYLNKAEFYVSHLIGHEGPGSLLSYLKRQGWANALASAVSGELSDFYTFEVTVELTNKGLSSVNDVIESIYSYIRLIRDNDIPNYILNEVLQLTELEWRFLTKGDPSRYVSSLVASMQKYEPMYYIAGPRRLALQESNTKLVNSGKPRTSYATTKQRDDAKKSAAALINKLDVYSAMVTILSKTFDGRTNKKERWYGTDYNVYPISSTILAKWKNCVRPDEIGLYYPKPNVFIPSESGLRVKKKVNRDKLSKSMSFLQRMTPISPPEIIRNDGMEDDDEGRWTVYYKQDDRFGQPKAFAIFQLLTKEVYNTVQNAVLAQLYQTCTTDKLEEYAYDATLAGLTYDIQVLPRGVRVTFGGYNDKLQDFAAYVIRKLSTDVMDILPSSDVEFDRYKDNVMRALSAFDVKQPYSHAIYYTGLCYMPRQFQYTNSELRSAMRKTTLPELEMYATKLWNSGKGVALIQGNLEQKEALAFVNTIDRTLNFKPIPNSDLPPRLKALKLPITQPNKVPTRLTISEPNPSNSNSAVQVTIQSLSRTEKDHVLIELLSAIIEDKFYEELRTKQQLGYIVSSGVKAIEETRNLGFIVQSSVVSTEKVTDEILKFLDGVKKNILDTLNEGDVALYVRGLLDRKIEMDKNLSVEVTRNWAEIASGRLTFNRIQREAAALLDVKKDDVVKFWDTVYYGNGDNGGGGRRMLISEIVPKAGIASSKVPPTTTGYGRGNEAESVSKDGTLKLGIDDIEQFRRDREQEALSSAGAVAAAVVVGAESVV